MVLDPDTVAALSALLGERFSIREADRRLHTGQETHHVSLPPDAVAWPVSTEEVAAIVRICAAAGVPIVPHGLGSSLEANVSAVRGGLSVDMMRMNRLLRVSTDDLDCTVEAGLPREDLNAALRDTGLYFPIDPGPNATIGGMAATRASGTSAVRYGTMRENILNLTVVTPQGEIIRTARRARKSSAGYDLTHLYVGSEGTLGIITEVTLRLHGRPEAVIAAVCTFPGPAEASRTAIEAIQIGLNPGRMEYLDAGAIRAVNAYSQMQEAEVDTLFVEIAGTEDEVETRIALFREIAEANGCSGFRQARAEEERTRLWKARHTAFSATVAARPGSRGWPTDVCVPIGSLADCIVHAKGLLADCPVPYAIMGHVGDGNFHVVFALDPESPEDEAVVSAINAAMVEKALSVDGTCTGEHGVGLGKRKYLEAEHGPALSVMRRIKAALDPQDLFNPGKILPDDHA
ncbi:FAD-binding oxidoreductase [Paenirhodobacter populi]|uniref:FAD-binding oxidoreductase n=1 Tax=Paenirhodobacter populi TaxID=2306993 RepID=UPI000FE4240A|nr:FAD-linked oxidase C-terminal domain-containing protein [Sinirhodobacter populi]RWR09102.1 FAD-binding protein [Sinirhodobacter populi]